MSLRTESDRNDKLVSIDIDQLATLFDYARDVAFFVKDADGCYRTVNKSLAIRHGCQKSEVIGKRPSQIVEGDFGEVPTWQDEEILKTGNALIEHLELQFTRPDNPVWCLTTKLPIKDSQDNVVGIIGFSRDLRIPVGVDEVPANFANALEEFEETLSEKVSPAWLAERSALSPQKLARLTKKLFGVTPTQFITKIRIAAACRLLQNTDQSVADIAYASGFGDHSAFSRAFRSASGITPSEFRKQG